MSTLAEIEAAVAKLPEDEQEQLYRQLAQRFRAPSCYELSRDLFEEPGRLGSSGIADLSTNKAHLADFGVKQRSSGK
jgi:hypothetical protein